MFDPMFEAKIEAPITHHQDYVRQKVIIGGVFGFGMTQATPSKIPK
jgi:hypothetical protein